MIVTNLVIENPDGSKTKMVFIDNENGTGFSMTEATYKEQQAANEATKEL
jgi:hypothetical protein